MNELETRIVEANARHFGISTAQMMETAGAEVARATLSRYPRARRVAVVCGLGNNGGDGLAAARFFSCGNAAATVVLLGAPDAIRSPEANANWTAIQKLDGIKKIISPDSKDVEKLRSELEACDVIIDAISGIGLSGELREPGRTAVELINSINKPVVAVDVPTGFGTALAAKADLVFSFILPKVPGAVVSKIGIPEEVFSLVGPGHLQALTKPSPGSKKGDNGIILVVGGGTQYHGAPIGAVKAAAKFVDLVYFASTRENQEILRKTRELKSQSADFISFKPADLAKAAAKADAVLIGPGLDLDGKNKTIVNTLVKQLTKENKKIILDATALRLVDARLLGGNACVTPHAGEFKALFGEEATPEAAAKAARKHGCTILLKGRIDYITSPDLPRVMRNYTGNEGMTKGGTGDVLAGLVAAFAAKNSLGLAACAGAFLNGLAGDQLKRTQGTAFSAGDLACRLPEAFATAIK